MVNRIILALIFTLPFSGLSQSDGSIRFKSLLLNQDSLPINGMTIYIDGNYPHTSDELGYLYFKIPSKYYKFGYPVRYSHRNTDLVINSPSSGIRVIPHSDLVEEDVDTIFIAPKGSKHLLTTDLVNHIDREYSLSGSIRLDSNNGVLDSLLTFHADRLGVSKDELRVYFEQKMRITTTNDIQSSSANRAFYNQDYQAYIELSRKALRPANISRSFQKLSIRFMKMGIAHQLNESNDSALYYYDESLKVLHNNRVNQPDIKLMVFTEKAIIYHRQIGLSVNLGESPNVAPFYEAIDSAMNNLHTKTNLSELMYLLQLYLNSTIISSAYQDTRGILNLSRTALRTSQRVFQLFPTNPDSTTVCYIYYLMSKLSFQIAKLGVNKRSYIDTAVFFMDSASKYSALRDQQFYVSYMIDSLDISHYNSRNLPKRAQFELLLILLSKLDALILHTGISSKDSSLIYHTCAVYQEYISRFSNLRREDRYFFARLANQNFRTSFSLQSSGVGVIQLANYYLKLGNTYLRMAQNAKDSSSSYLLYQKSRTTLVDSALRVVDSMEIIPGLYWSVTSSIAAVNMDLYRYFFYNSSLPYDYLGRSIAIYQDVQANSSCRAEPARWYLARWNIAISLLHHALLSGTRQDANIIHQTKIALIDAESYFTMGTALSNWREIQTHKYAFVCLYGSDALAIPFDKPDLAGLSVPECDPLKLRWWLLTKPWVRR